MNDVTAIVISFLRPAYTEACIRSLRATYPDIHILVGENGEHDKKLASVCKEVGAEYIQMPYDSGVCYARNRLVEHVETEYVLVGDDDFYYTETAKADRMAELLRMVPDAHLVGGRINEGGVVRNYQGHTEKIGRHFKITPLDLETERMHKLATNDTTTIEFCRADLTYNYFVAKTGAVRAVPWDEGIKVAYEHFSWFWDFKQAGYKALFAPEPIVVHKPEHVEKLVAATPEHEKYREYRNRRTDKAHFYERYDVDYTIAMNGQHDYAPGHRVERTKNDARQIDFCITTFKRPHAVRRLMLSIAQYYPNANVYVADQNETFDRTFYKSLQRELWEAGLVKRPCIEHLKYDIGLSAARNHLVTTTPNKYKLILDDDMVVTDRTDIAKFVSVLESAPRAGVVGGTVEQLGTEVHFEFTIEKRGDTLYHVADKTNWKSHNGIRYRKTGCVLNFALFHKDVFNYVRWDERLKVTEHLDFYIRMQKAPYSVYYVPDVVIDHPPVERSPDYKELRQRPEFLAYMLRKHGARRVKYLNGQVTELQEDGTITRYKEQPEP